MEITREKVADVLVITSGVLVSMSTAFLVMIVGLYAFTYVYIELDLVVNWFYSAITIGSMIGIFFSVYLAMIFVFDRAWEMMKKSYKKKRKQKLEKKRIAESRSV
jgi:hypothetical protein